MLGLVFRHKIKKKKKGFFFIFQALLITFHRVKSAFDKINLGILPVRTTGYGLIIKLTKKTDQVSSFAIN